MLESWLEDELNPTVVGGFWSLFGKQNTSGSAACVQACSAVSHLCNHMDRSPPGSCAHGIFQQQYQRGLPFPTLGDLPDPEIEPKSPASPALAGGFLPLAPPGQPSDDKWLYCFKY